MSSPIVHIDSPADSGCCCCVIFRSLIESLCTFRHIVASIIGIALGIFRGPFSSSAKQPRPRPMRPMRPTVERNYPPHMPVGHVVQGSYGPAAEALLKGIHGNANLFAILPNQGRKSTGDRKSDSSYDGGYDIKVGPGTTIPLDRKEEKY